MSEVYKYEMEIEDNNFVDEERQGYGAYIQATVFYRLEDVVEADTPFGPILRQEIVIEDIEDPHIFVSDQDGGELYNEECDLYDFMSHDEIIEEIEKYA